jgi:glycosyltransferase involved in cell wall biosynthesis
VGQTILETKPLIAVVIPCYNEAASIYDVVKGFQHALPQAEVHVFDNASTDATAELAKKAGAILHTVRKKGKGNVVQAMFRDVEADLYIMADGDNTYPAHQAPQLIELIIKERADVVVGNRMSSYHGSNSRSGHHFGNRTLTKAVNRLFLSEYGDLLSGYRVLSRRFVKSTPLFSQGFEVETALSIHAVEVGAKVIEVPIAYAERVEGSESKLSTFRDGFKIALTIFRLFKDYNPKAVYGLLACLFFLSGLLVGTPVIVEYLQTGLVPRFPSAILASGLMILSGLTAVTGVILSAISKSRRDIKKLAFLSLK